MPYKDYSNILGKKIGKWTVKKLIDKGKFRRATVECQCECGVMVNVVASYLVNGKTKACRNCCRKKAVGVSAFNRLFRQYKRQAEKRGLEWGLSKSEFMSIIKQDCYYTGIKPSNIMRTQGGSIVYNGIDRIDNKKGYTYDNCVACNGEVNRMKSNLSYSQFIDICNSVYEKNKERTSFSISKLKAV